MRLFRKLHFLALMLASVSLFSEESLGEDLPLHIHCGPYTFSRFEIKHTEHKGIGWDQGYSTAGLFVCPSKDMDILPFFNAKLHVFNNGHLASNVGMGCRFSSPSEEFVFGLNGFYDFRSFKSLSTHQGAGGLEANYKWLRFSANAYIPFAGKAQEDDIFFHSFKNNNILVQQRVRFAQKHVDAQIGFELPNPFKQVNLYLGLGYYYLFKRSFREHSVEGASGGRIVLEAEPFDWLSLGSEYSYDKLGKSRVNGYLAFNIPLGKRKLKNSSKDRYPYKPSRCDLYLERMINKTKKVIRDEIIPIESENKKFAHNTPAGFPHNVIFVNNTGVDPSLGTGTPILAVGDGSFEQPYTTLAQAQLNSSEGDIIYVFFGDGTTKGYDTGYTLLSGQSLVSSGTDVTVSGVLIPAFTPGQFAKITKSSGNIIFANNNLEACEVHGFQIIGNSSASAVRSLASAVSLRRNTITAQSGQTAVEYDDIDGTSTITENTITCNGTPLTAGGAIETTAQLLPTPGSMIVTNNTIASAGFDGIHFDAVPSQTTITGNTITSTVNTGNNGIFLNETVSDIRTFHVQDNTISDGFETGINLQWNNSGSHTLTLNDNKITSPDINTAILAQSSAKNAHLEISSNTIENTASGIDVSFTGSQSTVIANIKSNKIDVSGIAISGETSSFVTTSTINISDNPSILIGGDSNAIDLNLNSQGTTTVSNNSISYLGVTPSTGIGINIDYSNSFLQTNTIEVASNTVNMNANASAIEVEAFDNTRTVLTVRDNLKGNSRGNIIATSNSSEPFGANIIENFASSSTGSISLNNSSTGEYEAISSTAPTKAGISTSNNNVTVNTTGTIVFVPPGTPLSPFTAVFVNNASKETLQDGTFHFPFKSIVAAENASSSGDILYVFPGSTLYDTQGTGDFILQSNQTLAGSGTSITIHGTVIDPLTPGKSPTLTVGADNRSVVTLSAGSETIQGIIIDVTEKTRGSVPKNINGILVSGTSTSATITNNTINIGAQLTDSSFRGPINITTTNPNQTIQHNVLSADVQSGSSVTQNCITITNPDATGGTDVMNITNNTFNFDRGAGILLTTTAVLDGGYTLNFNKNTYNLTGSSPNSALQVNLLPESGSTTTLNVEDNEFKGNHLSSATTYLMNLSSGPSTVGGKVIANVNKNSFEMSGKSIQVVGTGAFNLNASSNIATSSNTNTEFLAATASLAPMCIKTIKNNLFANYVFKHNTAGAGDVLFFTSQARVKSDQQNTAKTIFDFSGATFNNTTCPND